MPGTSYVLQNNVVQASTIPTATASIAGKIIQYVGATTNDYTNGYFYECYETATTNVYDWRMVDIAAGSIAIDTRLNDIVGDIATVESATAVAAHSINDFLIYNGDFYKVINTINIGDNLTVNTNIKKTTISDELKALINSTIYDSIERVVGVWDDKPMYQKTLEFDNITSGTQNIAHNISNVSKITVKNWEFISTGHYIVGNEFSNDPGWCANVVEVDSTNVKYILGTDWQTPTLRVVLQYTKTTD